MTDNWQEGEDSRECDDCGRTAYSCRCGDVICHHCGEVIPIVCAEKFNEDYFCIENCINLFLNET